ncbi:MAG: hypothetical protein HYZ69_03030, partial [Candidatus Colwellbacteria bacterium]|nr:hypothetical protein [Candidatus Colwellbacteria bacterium]
KLEVVDPNEIVVVECTLPREYEYEGIKYPITDTMRPGTAFLAMPYGASTKKCQKRLYTRSNVSVTESRVLQTIINDTHNNADTSLWWQMSGTKKEDEEKIIGPIVGDTIFVRCDFSSDKSELIVHEHYVRKEGENLRLERDDWWQGKKFLGYALSTGITPFLAHLRYMAHVHFRRYINPNTHYALIVSAKNPMQLMYHHKLLALEKRFPEHFTYHPVLTRQWFHDWPYTRGRLIPKDTTDIHGLLNIVPDLKERHVRMCGNKVACEQLKKGLEESGIQPQSFKAEVW